MKYTLLQLFLLVLIMVLSLNAGLSMDPETLPVKKFSVISEYAAAALFYPAIRGTKLRFHNEPDIDVNTRMQICRDIMGSDFFITWGYYPYEKATHPVMRLVPGPNKDMNPIKKLNVSIYGSREPFPEYGIICPSQKRSWDKIIEFFVSEEYNVGCESDSSEHHIAARFIFRPADEKTYLYLMAEEPAKAELNSQIDVELDYLKMREENNAAHSLDNDPLCRLDRYEKIRICISVFESPHFQPEDRFTRNEFDGACARRTVSFRTDEAKEKATATGQLFQEWTMLCKSNEVSNYYLSRAYKSNEIMVHLWDADKNEMYLKTRMTKVRIENL